MSYMSNPIDYIIPDKQVVDWSSIFLEENNKAQLEQFLKEQKYIDELKKYGLPINNKVLLHGASGCGKTMTAKAIAQYLDKPIYIVDLSNLISARIGDTPKNLKAVFDKASREKGVLFIDEFDQIGKMRSNDDKDVGEMRRLVNSLLQLIDYFSENAILFAATNHIELLDTALIRRFQLRIPYAMPQKEVLDKYYDTLLHKFPENLKDVDRKYNISFAEAKDYVFTEVKSKLISQLEKEEN